MSSPVSAQDQAPGAAAAERTPAAAHRVIIVGGGFAGLFAARWLRRAPVAVTIVDRSANHVFQPMLYQCATGIIPEATIAPTLRDIFARQRNARVMLAEVVGFDLGRRTVHARSPIGEELTLEYDSLIVGTGASTSYFGHDEFARYAPGMKTVDDAATLRHRIFGAFEVAAETADPEERQAWLTFAIVGAGPTGVELAGQIRVAARHTLRREFRAIDADDNRVLLFDGGKEPLATFGDRLAERATRTLEQMGVELHMGSLATSVDASGLEVKSADGEVRHYEARTVIWAAGVAASPLGRLLAEGSGGSTDRAGRVKVLPDCTLPGHPEVFVVGDLMSLDHLPGVAEVAMQAGLHAGRTIKRRLLGKPTHPFRYRDLGSMAYVGHFRAIVDFHGLKLSGFFGWLMWLVVHITFLTGFANRFAALMNWAVALSGKRRSRIFSASDLSRQP
jgi:NADH dehydrogenase